MPPTIMIVDDDEQILLLVEILLRRQGYQVQKVSNPATAIDLINTTPPDLFVLDYMMPGMNGIELLQHIRLHPNVQNAPVIMLSAVNSEEFTRESFEAGANANIPKSEMHRRLLKEVREFLASAPSR
ncbi:MAG TPA: response regulator [Phototrophicaceae bacterium]|nr:response regulator [Phototrophicaceae bacterium]